MLNLIINLPSYLEMPLYAQLTDKFIQIFPTQTFLLGPSQTVPNELIFYSSFERILG
jgi:hypothetical protein